jgi:protease-4
MGDVAASGGYYMAMACDEIIAAPTTITGSIGVFALMFNFEPFMADKLGITNDEVLTGPLAGLGNQFDDFSEAEKQFLQSSVTNTYQRFIEKVASGRNIDIAAVDAVAQGRVWAGKQAAALGLVDKLGGIDQAIESAAALAKLSDTYGIYYYNNEDDYWERILGVKTASLKQHWLRHELGQFAAPLQQLEKLKSFSGLQMRMADEPQFR